MHYITWNIKCYCNINKIIDFLQQHQTESSCIIALQEVTPKSFETINRRMGKDFQLLYSLDLREPGKFDTDNRKLGVLLAISNDYKIHDWDLITRSVFPERTLWAVITDSESSYEIAVMHSVTGCSYKMTKAVQFRTFAEYVNSYEPDIVSFDANEPEIDHYDISKMKFWDQRDKGEGARLFFEELQNQNMRDIFAEKYNTSEYIEGKPLTVSHKAGPKKTERRYDFIFARKELKVKNVQYIYDEAMAASSDHAAIIADLEFLIDLL